MHRVFVYGTLKRGFPNYGFIPPDARYAGEYRTSDAYPLLIGGHWFTPYLLDEPGRGHQVKGEIFEVDDAALAILDELESVGLANGYHRKEIVLKALATNQAEVAWVYLIDRAKIAIIRDDRHLEEYPHDPRYVIPARRHKQK